MSTPDTFTIDRVYPWGRSLEEYRRMFGLSDADVLRSRVLAVADGPASFNAEATRLGGSVVSADPLYRFSADEIRARVAATRDVLVAAARRDAHRFVWERIRSPEELGELRTRATETFLADYELGRRVGRYLDRSLPQLGFGDDRFDVALCSHFLFLYADEFPLSFHIDSIAEMARLAGDVRVFPLLDMRGEPSRHVGPACEALRRRGLRVRVEAVDYEFQRGGNEMLRVTR